MMKYRIIYNIRDKIQKILEFKGLEPKKPLPGPKSLYYPKFYSTICTDLDGKEYFFKARLIEDTKARRSFLTEIYCADIINHLLPETKDVSVRKLVDFQVDKLPEWVLFKTVSGKEFNKYDFPEKYIDLVVEALLVLRKISYSLIPKREHWELEKEGLWETDFVWYLGKCSFYLNHLRSEIDYQKAQKIAGLIYKNKKVIDRCKKVLSHGDFALPNLFFKKDKITLIDWEKARIDLPIADLAFIFVPNSDCEWSKKIVRKYFKKTKKTKEKEILFTITVVRQCLKRMNSLKELYEKKIIKKDWFDKELGRYSDLLSKSLKGFDVVMR